MNKNIDDLKNIDIKEKQEQENQKNKYKKNQNKLRIKLVLLFIVVVSLVMYFFIRANYLEYLELGENYVEIFKTNMELKIRIITFSFLIIFGIMFFTNLGIKKGLKTFFEKENIKMPKLINKSISLVIAVISSIVISEVFLENIMMFAANTSFGGELVLGFDISYYMFQKPLIEQFLLFLIIFLVGLTIYTVIYYVLSFNICFEKGVDGSMIKDSKLIKTICKNVIILSIIVASLIIVNTQDIVYGKILEIDNNIEVVGAGITESTIQYYRLYNTCDINYNMYN